MNNNQTLMSILIGVLALGIGLLIGTLLLNSSSSDTSGDADAVNIRVPATVDGASTQLDVVWFSNLTGIVQSVNTQEVTIAVESPDIQAGDPQTLVRLPIQFHPNNDSPVNEYRQDNATGSIDAIPSSVQSITPGNRVGLNIKRETTGELVVEQITIFTEVN